MVDLSTTYMGIPLRNPLMVASCGLVKDAEGVKRAEQAGAGAVVLKSLFEEQLQVEADELDSQMKAHAHPEALAYVRSEVGMRFGAADYAKRVEASKKAVSIPVIASINCVSARWWIPYAKEIASAGPDALELNISRMPADPDCPGEAIERLYYSIVEDVRAAVDIPLAVKVGPYFTSFAYVAQQLAARGASALVLFNRFYRPDISVTRLEPTAARPFSSPEEISLPLRWIALLAGKVPCDLAASTGVHDAQGLIKLLLAGASVVQACSTFYLEGFEQIGRMLDGLQVWMKKHQCADLEQVRQKMQPLLSEQPEGFERLQYIKIFGGME